MSTMVRLGDQPTKVSPNVTVPNHVPLTVIPPPAGMNAADVDKTTVCPEK